MEEKTIAASQTVLTAIMQLSQTNLAGNIHGGQLMTIMDNVAGLCARRHSEQNIVTARADEILFHLPVRVGCLVTCHGEIQYVGTSSMEVAVTLYSEDLIGKQPKKLAVTGYFTLVALDEKGRPTPVPPLRLETEEERQHFEAGKKRAQENKAKLARKK